MERVISRAIAETTKDWGKDSIVDETRALLLADAVTQAVVAEKFGARVRQDDADFNRMVLDHFKRLGDKYGY